MKKPGRIILGVIILFLILFGVVFLVSLILFPEWIGKDNWVKILIVAIIAAGGEIFIEKVLDFSLTEFINLTNLSQRIQYHVGNKYKNIEDRVQKFTKDQIGKEKKSGKYIPSVFIETVNVKEKLRYFSDPYLFIQKILENAKNDIQATLVYSLLKEIYFPLEKISLPKPNRKNKLNKYIEQARIELAKMDHYSEVLNEKESGLLDEYLEMIPTDKRYLHDYHRAYLYRSGTIEIIKNTILENLQLFSDTSALITSQAGRGKTNLLCDFTENYLLRKKKFCLYFSGHDFNYMGRNETIEEAISRIVFSEEECTFEDLISIVEFNRHYDYLFIVIDGINEHEDLPQFEQALEQFSRRNLDEKVKIIFSCRTEYLSERFGRLLDLDGLSKLSIDDPRKEIPKTHQNYLLQKYFEHFRIALEIGAVAEWIQELFYNDKLLLRFFCEAYENEVNLNSLQNIYRFEIFSKYYTRKCQEVHGLEDCLAEITSYMIKNSTFIDISFDHFSNKTKKVLKGLFDESLLFRKDLIEDPALAFGRKEVFNFVYDEFREFLLASAILHSWRDDPEKTISQIDELIHNSNVIAEGLQRYLCSWSIKEADEILLNHLRNYELFNSVFIENIFAIPDQDISDHTLEILTEVFFESPRFSRQIIIRLISRCNPEVYPKLNIEFVIKQISKMNIEQYDDLIQHGLLDDYRYMQQICQGVIDAFREERVCEQSKPNILRFLMCLIGVEDKDWLHRDNDLGKFPVISTIFIITQHFKNDDISQIADDVISKIHINQIREELTSLVERLVG